MYTRSKSKKKRINNLNKTDLSNIVRRIEFDDPSYPSHKSVDSSSSSFSQLNKDIYREEVLLMSSTEEAEVYSNRISARKKKSKKTLDKLRTVQSSTANIDSNIQLSTPINKRDENFVSAREFFDNLPGERITSDYYSETDTATKLRRSTERLRLRKPLNGYIAFSSDEELEEWWKQPKTDYTYSASLSYRDTVTPERRIGSPNMSRKGIRGGSIATLTSPPYSSSSSRLDLQTSWTDNLSLRSREILRGGLSGFSDESDIEESQTVKSSETSVIKHITSVSSTRSTKDYHSILSTKSPNNISYGLDVDSDAEDESPHFARPIVRKGITCFLRKSRSQYSNSSETSAVIDKNQTEVDSTIPNGGLHYRLGNNIRTYLHSSTELSSNNYYHKNAYTIKQNWWKDVYRTFNSYIYSKFYDTLSLICSYILLWSSHLKNNVKKIVGKSLSARFYFTTKSGSPFKDRVTTTSTTIISRRRIIKTYFENTLLWYEKKRAQSPFLWGWLPLFLLLLLIPFLVYLFSPGEQGDRIVEKIPHSVYEFVSNGFSFLSQKFIQLTSHILKYFFLLINLFKYLIVSMFYIIIFLVNWLWSLLSHLVSYITSLHISTIFSDLKSGTSSESAKYEYSSFYYYPITLLSNGYSYTSENIRLGINYILASSSKTLILMSNTATALWNSLLWIALSIWSVLVTIAIEIFAWVWSFLSECAQLPYKLFMLIPSMNQSLKEKPDSKTIKVELQPEKPSVEYKSKVSDDVIQQILLNPELQIMIFNNLREKLSTEIRENLDSKFENMKTEFVHSHKHSEEFSSLKQHLENLQIKFDEVEDILKKMVVSQENTDNSVNSLHSLKTTIVEMSLKIGKLGEEIEDIQKNHTNFVNEMRSCCRNASTLTIEQVKDHIKVLLSDLIGLPAQDGKENENLALRFKEWVGKYFVAKEEMEKTLGDLVMKMEKISDNVVHEETLKQTSEQVMETVLDLLRADMKSEYQVLRGDLNNLKESTDSTVSQLNLKLVENSNSIEKSKIDIENVVEKSVSENIERHLLQLKDSLSSDDNLDIELKNKLLAAVTPLIEETIGKNFRTNEIKNFIDSRVTNIVTEKLDTEMEQIKKSSGDYSSNSGKLSFSLNAEDVDKIVREALLKYDADKTGMADHALESAGGTIVSTRCTEEYEGHFAELTVYGYSLYRYSTNTPRSIIQPDRNPGQCYAFKGSEGYIVIQLAGPVRITGFTVEHVPKNLTPYSTIDSAVKEFSVYGLQKTDEEGFSLGRFVYQDNGEPLQYFPVKNLSDEYFKYVELKIHSNYGNMKFTCVYRFRVHGVREDFHVVNGV